MSERRFDVDLPPPGLSERAQERWAADDLGPRGSGGGPKRARDPWAPLGGRLFYLLSAALSALLLFILFNPEFGRMGRMWFWDVLRGDEDGRLWTQDFATVAVLLGLVLGYLTCVFLDRSPARGIWALAWVAFAFVAFAADGEELRFFTISVLIGVSAGVLAYVGRIPLNPGSRALVFVVVLLVAAQMFMPFPPDDQGSGEESYRSIAFGLVWEVREAGTEAAEEGVSVSEYLWNRLLGWLPQHILAVFFVLLLLRLMGLRGAWIPITGNVLVLALIGGMSWVLYETGAQWGGPSGANWSTWWAGLHEVGVQLQSRFTPHLLALAAGLGDLGLRLRD